MTVLLLAITAAYSAYNFQLSVLVSIGWWMGGGKDGRQSSLSNALNDTGDIRMFAAAAAAAASY
jgi:hypothetical protein